MTLLRQKMLVVATAGLLGGLAIATATPDQSANAQSGQSLVFAEHACLEYGVTPHTAAFESCVRPRGSRFRSRSTGRRLHAGPLDARRARRLPVLRPVA